MVASACSMLARVAGTDWGESILLLPENSSTLKVSLGLQAADQAFEHRLGRVERKAVHRARDVDHEDVVARRDRAGGHGLGRLDHREKEVLGASVGVLPWPL
jgi:hypothetical protein